MFEQTFKNIDDILHKDAGCGSELDYVEQTSWVLFLKYLDDLEKGTRQPTSKPSAPTTPAQPKAFSSQADVQKAITEGKVKKGDKVTVNGVTGTIK